MKPAAAVPLVIDRCFRDLHPCNYETSSSCGLSLKKHLKNNSVLN